MMHSTHCLIWFIFPWYFEKHLIKAKKQSMLYSFLLRLEVEDKRCDMLLINEVLVVLDDLI